MKPSILFGPAGNILKTITETLPELSRLGLSAMEVEFVRQVHMGNPASDIAGKLAKEHGVRLSVHGSYYINLSSLDPQIVKESKERILLACERAHHMGASPVVIHAGYYQKREPDEVYGIVKREITELMGTLRQRKWNTTIAPETTGKGTQFGTVDELIRLSRETGCSICVDFAHLRARNNGPIDYDEVMGKLKGMAPLHCHFSGIEYTSKGERKHLLTEEKDIRELLGALISHGISATIINESPDPGGDAVKMKGLYEKLT